MGHFIVNDQIVNSNDFPPGMVALDFIRNILKLKGTKEGCKEGECGACTILVGKLNKQNYIEYKAVASCILPVGALNEKHVVTVEGLNNKDLNTVQNAIFKNNASQCGFCTPGIVLSLTGFLLTSENFSYQDALNALDGNICRCTGYYPIRNAAKELSEKFAHIETSPKKRMDILIKHNVLPDYFKSIPERLAQISTDKKNKTYPAGFVPVGGGTDLFVLCPEELIPKNLLFISEIKNSKLIEEKNSFIHIGANVTVEEFRKSKIIHKYFPSFEKSLLLVSSTIMRNKATLTGNLVNASPIGDLSIILLSLNASLVLQNKNKTRELALNKFFKGYKDIDLAKGEIIQTIKIPILSKHYKFSFEKVSNRKHLDIAACNSGLYIEIDKNIIQEIRISAGGVAPIPMLLKKTAEKLKKQKLNAAVLTEALEISLKEVSPIDDIRGTAKYKKLLLRQLIYAHFVKLFPEIFGEKELVK